MRRWAVIHAFEEQLGGDLGLRKVKLNDFMIFFDTYGKSSANQMLATPRRVCVKPLVHTRPDAPPDDLAVLLPVLAILAPALLLVAHLTVDQEDGEVQHVEVSDRDRVTLDSFLRHKAGARVED